MSRDKLHHKIFSASLTSANPYSDISIGATQLSGAINIGSASTRSGDINIGAANTTTKLYGNFTVNDDAGSAGQVLTIVGDKPTWASSSQSSSTLLVSADNYDSLNPKIIAMRAVTNIQPFVAMSLKIAEAGVYLLKFRATIRIRNQLSLGSAGLLTVLVANQSESIQLRSLPFPTVNFVLIGIYYFYESTFETIELFNASVDTYCIKMTSINSSVIFIEIAMSSFSAVKL
jgi:hypothetical protein